MPSRWRKLTFTSDRMRYLLAVLMAGGRGKRLRPITYKTPKPLLKINGKVLLEYTLNSLLEAGIKSYQIIVCLKYKPYAFQDFLRAKNLNYFLGSSNFCVKNLYEIIDTEPATDILVMPTDVIQPKEVIKESLKVYRKYKPDCLFHARGKKRVERVKSISTLRATTSLSIWKRKALEKVRDEVSEEFEYSDLAILFLKHNLNVFYFYTPHKILEIDTIDDLRRVKKIMGDVNEKMLFATSL